MPRKDGSGGVRHTIKQRGYARRGSGVGSYSAKGKAKKADRYDRPYIDGTYGKH